MDTGKLDKWAELLLDMGKRNNLINFKDTKLGTVEIAAPLYTALFDKADRDTIFEVYDADADSDEDGLFADEEQATEKKFADKHDYFERYSKKIKGNQILLWNAYGPLTALSSIAKKADAAIEETGVNIAYIAFGFVHWFEANDPEALYRAPLLLIPVTIERKARTEAFKIKPTGDDAVLNPTFAFKLQSEYGVTLPEYSDEGISRYFDALGEIFEKLKWTLTRECKIGIFSFLKINMYRDLKDNADEILLNRNIRILLGEPVEEETSLKEQGESAQRNVVDADSSQAEAVALAKTGESFVLQGPPGTGKSQTITNLIAECISDGKRVLFVSEKLAALNVVYDKLKKAGLAEFCLELHSHKANKKEVIAELCRTLRLPKNTVSAEAAEYTDELKRAEDKLCAYEKELHCTRPVINRTLYGIFGEISRLRNTADCDLVIEDISNKGEEFLNDAADALSQYAQYVPSVGEDFKRNVWYGYKINDGSYSSKIMLKSKLQTLSAALKEIIYEKEKFTKLYEASCPTVGSLNAAQRFFALAANSKYLSPVLLSADEAKAALEKLNAAFALYKEVTQAKAYLDENYDGDIYKQDGAANYKLLTKKYGGAFSRLFSKEYKNIRSEISLCRRDNKKVSYTEAVTCAKNLAAFKSRTEEFATAADGLPELDIKNFKEADFNAAVSDLTELEKVFAEGFESGNIRFLSAEEYSAQKRGFASISRTLEKHLSALSGSLDFVADSFEKSEFDFYAVSAEAASDKACGLLEDIDGLDNWLAFYYLLQRLEKLQLTEFLGLTANGGVPAEKLADVFRKAFFKQWADCIVRSSDVLSALSRIPHDKTVETFASTDRLQFEINKAKIRAKLSSMRPSTSMVTAGGAVSVLLREGEKKRRQKSIRTLLSETGELIQILKPCFLMSPLSVSTFLESSKIRFDTVIFDEASQIFPQDAAGAIYRGKQLIVVGDSRQMPPSNFFNAVADAPEDDDEGVTDFESILDLCSTALPQKRLKWHYRSRYEQLISFSNKNFYDFELVTFPSCRQDKNKDGIGVDFHYIGGGTFDRKTKTNLKEAEYVVDLIYDNIKKYPERSLGVVAFSISQQSLIEKLLNRRRAATQNNEEFFKADAAEPFFIKNLETVQGDERDTIIFSVGYAKDEEGKLLHNFGPLNRVGGERRLNVAITRAKHNVQVVASMKYTAIDLKRTKSAGARLLRDYLDYAENGSTALERADEAAFEKPRLELQKEVCEFLKDSGFEADMQVGCSGMKIDVAVKDKNGADYVLAVECDGESYHSGRNARDRDRLRREVLERMGWRFYRVWSADWIRSNKAEKERLLYEAEAAVNGKGKPTLSSKQRQTEDVKKNDNINSDGDNAKNSSSFISAAEDKPYEFPEYKTADIPTLRRKYPNDFISFVREMLETEAPLSEELLLQRIAFMFNYYGKVTPAVVREYENRMRRADGQGIIRRNGFLYLEGRTETPFRRVGKFKREVKEVSLEELASGMRTLLMLNVSVDREGLFREIMNQLGFNRLTEPVKHRLGDALKILDGETQIDGNRITLK